MAVRIPWDKYETAILIDACIKVQNNILSKEIAVSEVSADLRRLAISRGYEIDDIFRNENGISMQMTIMSALLQNRPSGLHNASKLFSEIRDIYINDNDAYIQILTEAKAMINGKEDAKTLLIKYIKEKASKKADDIVFAIDKISEFAIATKVLNVSIYNNLTPEALNLLRKRVVTNKFFVVKNKKIMNNVQQAMILLDNYILSNSTTDNTEDVLLETQSTKAASTDKATSEFIIDFNEIPSLAFTKPFKFKYKEITTINISSWTDLYIKIMREFIDEFPSRLLPGINFFSGERVDLGTSYHLDNMRAPKPLTDTLYLETNLSATDIVKKIKSVMDLCDVDFSNLTIYYLKKDNSYSNATSSGGIATRKRHTNTAEKDEFLTYLVEEAGVSENTARSYALQINGCEYFAIEYSIGTGKLYTADTKTEAYENAMLLLSDNDFQTYSRNSHNAPVAALRKYIQFIEAVKKIINIQLKEIKKEFDHRVISTLEIHYNYGINISSPIEILRFRNNYSNDHGEEYAYSDNELINEIKLVGMEFDGKIYLISSETTEKIKDKITSAVEQGVFIVYFEKFYNENEEWLYESHILSPEMFREVISMLFAAYQIKQNYFILSESKSTELNALKQELARVWGDNKLRSFSELHQLLPWIPLDKIKYALSYSEKYFWNSFETYTNKDFFVITDEQISELQEFISISCDENGSVPFDELPLYEISSENYELSETALFDIVFSFFEDSYSRNGKVITRKGVSIDVTTAIAQFCRGKENCKMGELEAVMQEVTGEVRYPVIIDAANVYMVRVDCDTFVADNKITFDVTNIDSVLDDIVYENGIGLKEITTFNAFPYCGYQWNLFLLESYCRRFSSRYRYTCITPNSRNAGVIIAKNNNMDFHNIMAKAIARANIEINETDVFEFLIASGFMIRRQYANMNELLKLAAVFREGR